MVSSGMQNPEAPPEDQVEAGEQPEALGEMTFVEHLIEVRNRLVKTLIVIVVLFLGLFPFANTLYLMVSAPLRKLLPEGASMIATEVASPFLTPFKLSLVCAIFLAMPYALYHLWSFVAPGLYRNERKLVYPLLISSTLLFYLGMVFAYYVVFPLMFGFFTSAAPQGVEIMTDISRYLDFVLKIFFAFGIAFEVPIATILVIWAGFTTPEALSAKRPYVIVTAFVVGMLLTPPDAISQTLLALPMWVLFELGLMFSKFYLGDRRADEEQDPA